jgi:hypothetical protein
MAANETDGHKARLNGLERRVDRVENSHEQIMEKLTVLHGSVAGLVQKLETSGTPGQSPWCKEHENKIEVVHGRLNRFNVRLTSTQRRVWGILGAIGLGSVIFLLMVKHLVDDKVTDPGHSHGAVSTNRSSSLVSKP